MGYRILPTSALFVNTPGKFSPASGPAANGPGSFLPGPRENGFKPVSYQPYQYWAANSSKVMAAPCSSMPL